MTELSFDPRKFTSALGCNDPAWTVGLTPALDTKWELRGYAWITLSDLVQYAKHMNVYVEIEFAIMRIHVYSTLGLRDEEMRLLAETANSQPSYQSHLHRVVKFAHMANYAAAVESIGKTLNLLNVDINDHTVRVNPTKPQLTIFAKTYNTGKSRMGLECMSRLLQIHGVREVVVMPVTGSCCSCLKVSRRHPAWCHGHAARVSDDAQIEFGDRVRTQRGDDAGAVRRSYPPAKSRALQRRRLAGDGDH